MKLPDQIRQARLTAGLTIDKVAARTGMSKGAISAIENGNRNVTVSTLERLAEAMEYELVIEFKY